MAIQILKNTHNLAVVKFYGTAMNDTLSLNNTGASGLRLATQIGGTPNVSIAFASWAVSPAAADVITVTRNSIVILTLYQNGQLDFSGNGGFADNIAAINDIVVTSVGTGQLYLTLRKTGYISTIEPEYFGPYDNSAVVGS
jgi:hypothetical protein